MASQEDDLRNHNHQIFYRTSFQVGLHHQPLNHYTDTNTCVKDYFTLWRPVPPRAPLIIIILITMIIMIKIIIVIIIMIIIIINFIIIMMIILMITILLLLLLLLLLLEVAAAAICIIVRTTVPYGDLFPLWHLYPPFTPGPGEVW